MTARDVVSAGSGDKDSKKVKRSPRGGGGGGRGGGSRGSGSGGDDPGESLFAGLFGSGQDSDDPISGDGVTSSSSATATGHFASLESKLAHLLDRDVPAPTTFTTLIERPSSAVSVEAEATDISSGDGSPFEVNNKSVERAGLGAVGAA